MEGAGDLDKDSFGDSAFCPSPLPELEQDPFCQMCPSLHFSYCSVVTGGLLFSSTGREHLEDRTLVHPSRS